MRWHRGLLPLVVLAVLAASDTADAAAILYNIYGGFQMVGESSVPLPTNGGGDVPGFVEGGPRSRGGAICPAPTTPDFICGYAFASADLVGGSTFTLKAETRLERRQAIGVGAPEVAYGDARIELFGVTGILLPTRGYAKFNFILTGTTSQTPSGGDVTVEALATARLEVNESRGLQCLGTTCPPIEVRYDPSDSDAWDGTYIGVFLRADSRITGAVGAPINAEAIVDVRDTMVLTSIEVLDDDRQPVPGAAFVVDLGNGNVITIPNAPPSSTTTTTIVPGGSTTTTTTTPSGLTQRFLAGKTLALKDNAKPTKRSGTVIVTGDVIDLDPTQGGAELRLYAPATATRDTWPLPAAGWKKTKKGYKYTDKAQANGPVAAAVIAGGKLVVKAKGPAIAFPLLGTGPQQGIAMATLFPGSSAVLCADFTTPKKDDPAKGIFVASKAPAPAGCRAL